MIVHAIASRPVTARVKLMDSLHSILVRQQPNMEFLLEAEHEESSALCSIAIQ